MAPCWKTNPPLQPRSTSQSVVHHVLVPWKILTMHFGAQTPIGVGGDLLLDKNCSSLRTTQLQTRHWWIFLINGLHHWFQDTPTAPVSRFPQYESLVAHQSSIGWDKLIFGRWSTLWATPQSSYLQRQKIHPTSTNHGTGWTSRKITLIRTHCQKTWFDRNQVLHGHNQQTKNRADGIAPSSASGLYILISETQCSQFVCNCWFFPSIEDRVPDPTHLENWLAVNKARILCHVASRRNTKHITEYFTSIT
jgi:hypothetical protein